MQCPYAEIECAGPAESERWWACPIHGARLNQGLTAVCRARPAYFAAWQAGTGPLQKEPPRPNESTGLRIIAKRKPCPFGRVVIAIGGKARAAHGLARLDRCRTAKCGMLLAHKKTGDLVCVGRGRSCSWLRNWVAFLIGRADCPHWKAECRTECKCR